METNNDQPLHPSKTKTCCSSLRNNALANFTLKPEISLVNYLSYLVFITSVFAASYYLDIILVFLLRHPDYYNLPDSEVIKTTGNLIFYRSIVRLIVDPLTGSIHDVVPRKAFLIVSIILIVPIYILMPICRNVYPDLLLLMLVTGILLSNLYTTPIVGDLVAKNSLGFAMALTNLCIDLSRVIAVYVFLKLSQVVSIGWTMITVGVFLCVVALYLGFGLKRIPVAGKYHNVFKQMYSALKHIKRQPIFCFYFAYNTISYIFTYLSGTYVTVFIASSFGKSKDELHKAQALTTSIKGLGNIMNVLVSGSFGFVADKVPDCAGLTLSCLVMALGGVGFVLISSCSGYGIYAAYGLVIVGLQSSRIMVISGSK
eukprot:TRINITY_DN6438_c0_g1_i4.p1 TRINITY_DN6438_c0_g1~~TRINITY_DN6438_c0_g1_i4.p1  ORF type:complete len:371 (-),score=53.43 TRINITY_DN6438_c0_g1_i4:314-1426(-)